MPKITTKPHIIHAIANFMTGGSSQLVVDLAHYLGDLYHHEVITSFNPRPPAYEGIVVHVFDYDCDLGKLVNYFRQVNPALIHVHYWGDCDHAWYDKIFVAAGIADCKIIENINTPVEPYVTETIEHYVYVSNYVYNRFGSKKELSTVIYPGSDFTFFRRENFNEIPDDCIGMVYRLEPDKLNLQSIDVFIKVAQLRPQTKVLIVGGGTFLSHYKEAVHLAAVEKSFIFTGYVPYQELPFWYKQLSVFVAPVWKESFGQVSPFAMSYGIPVVGYDIGALEEIIGRRDLLAAPGDSGQLADIIIDLLDNREKRLAIGHSNQQRAHQTFSLESMIDGYKSVYANTIKSIAGIEEQAGKTRVALFVHCFFPDHFYGTETYTLKLAQNLRVLGYDPIIVSAAFPGENRMENVINYYEYDGLPVYCIDKNYYPHTRFKDTYYQEAMRDVLRSLLFRIKPDLVHVTHLINHTGILLEVLDDLKIPVVATMTDFYGHCLNGKLQQANGEMCTGPSRSKDNCLRCYLGAVHESHVKLGIQTRWDNFLQKFPWLLRYKKILDLIPGIVKISMKRTLDRVIDNNAFKDVVLRPKILNQCYDKLHAAIVPTKFTRKMYELNGLIVPVHEIRFGVDMPRTSKNRADGRPVRFGYAGQIDYHKGTDILVDAFCSIMPSEAELYIYGPENQAPIYYSNLTKKAQGYPIRFLGTFPQEKTAEILEEIDFLIIPSRWYENSPLILLSALASHTPVIVSDVDGMTEFVEEGRNGFIFKLGDVQDLARILGEITQDPEEYLSMTKNTEYLLDSKMMTMETIKIYEAMLAK